MGVFLNLVAVVLVTALSRGVARAQSDPDCSLPSKRDTDCSLSIFECEDQLDEGLTEEGQPISCLEINSMQGDEFELIQQGCDVRRVCRCTVAFHLHCDYDPDEMFIDGPKGDFFDSNVPAPYGIMYGAGPDANAAGGGGGGGGCFTGDTRVDTEAGPMTLRQLFHSPSSPRVKAIDAQDRIVLSKVRFWVSAAEARQEVVRITAGNRTISATGNHLVYKVPCLGSGSREAAFSAELRLGECVLAELNGQLIPTPIVSVDISEVIGIYTPLTEEGTLLADGIAASNYAFTKYETLLNSIFKALHRLHSLLSVNSRTVIPATQALLPFLSFPWLS